MIEEYSYGYSIIKCCGGRSVLIRQASLMRSIVGPPAAGAAWLPERPSQRPGLVFEDAVTRRVQLGSPSSRQPPGSPVRRR